MNASKFACWLCVFGMVVGCLGGENRGGDDDDDDNGVGGSGGGGCRRDADCGPDVCDTQTGLCFECLRSSDCGGDDVCVDRVCTNPAGCSGPADCAASGLLCDTAIGTCVECLTNAHCATDEVCAQSRCEIVGGTGGTGGSDGGGSGGASGGSGGSENGGTSGSDSGGSGAMGGTGGDSGASGNSGMGGSGGGGCDCPTGQECTVQGRCVNPDTIDDFADCDGSIYEVRGRSGAWYADADTGINVMFGVSNPGSAWSDNSCGAWSTGGPTGTGSATWGVIGTTLAGGSPYNLSDYTGITVRIETGQAFGLNITTSDGGNFWAPVGPTSGTQAFNVAFNTLVPRDDSAVQVLNPANITGVQFAPVEAAPGYGIAVHGVFLF